MLKELVTKTKKCSKIHLQAYTRVLFPIDLFYHGEYEQKPWQSPPNQTGRTQNLCFHHLLSPFASATFAIRQYIPKISKYSQQNDVKEYGAVFLPPV